MSTFIYLFRYLFIFNNAVSPAQFIFLKIILMLWGGRNMTGILVAWLNENSCNYVWEN